jgi:hypothetical protein
LKMTYFAVSVVNGKSWKAFAKAVEWNIDGIQ